MAVTNKFVKYGASWQVGTDPLLIELECIKNGGFWKSGKTGLPCGAGLFEHYMNGRKLIWPHRYRHRWTDLTYKTILENDAVVLMGSASVGKSASMAEMGLIKYWASPEDTAILISSTSRDKLEGAIFGEVKMLWLEGTLRHKWLAGHPIEHKQIITTDDLETTEVRDLRKGLIGKACFVGQNFVGLGTYAGLKQTNMWWLCDELQYMAPTVMDALPNMRSNTSGGGMKFIGSGNPNHDPESPLAIIGEPLDGWASKEDNEKTEVWPIRLSGGVCVNFIGTDSPNFDQEEDIYPKLIGHAFEKIMRHDRGLNSPMYETQVKGRMKTSLAKSRVITRKLCRDHRAHELAVWEGTTRTKIHACDPAYGGGDRCISIWGEFGFSSEKQMILRVAPPRIIRINLKDARSPEDQIAEEVKRELEDRSIPPDHSFYDSFGKGTIGNAFAKAFGHNCPVPIDAGQRPTKRPVRYDLFVQDEVTHTKRLKRCDEEYGKFITEMWFSARNLIECGQMRELPEDVMKEGCGREYGPVAGNKIDVEPKAEMEGRSPDLFDACFIGETLVSTPFGNVRIDRVKVGDWVLTPFGPSRIWRISCRRTNELATVKFSNGTQLSGLGEHRVFVWKHGWIPLDSLSIRMEIESICKLPLWNFLNWSFTKDESTVFKLLVDTIKTRTGEVRLSDFYTDLSGSSRMDLFLKTCASITKMAIGRITASRIWGSLKRGYMQATTCVRIGLIQIRENFSCRDCQIASMPRGLGMQAMKVSDGILKMVKMRGNCAKENPAFALNADVNSRHFSHPGKSCFAQQNVAAKGSGEGLRLLKGAVLCVVASFRFLSFAQRSIVPVTVQRSRLQESKQVFDLTLEDHNAYYANGILVENCAHLIEGARRLGFKINRLGKDADTVEPDDEEFFEKEAKKYRKLINSKLLQRS